MLKETNVDPSESISPHLRILKNLSKLEEEVLSYLTEDWTVSILIAEQAPHLTRQTISNNLMRLHKRDLVERTFPTNVKANEKYYDGVRLWRRKA